MRIKVTAYRNKNINHELLNKAFLDLGWESSGKIGIGNITYFFIWKSDKEPIFPDGYEYEAF